MRRKRGIKITACTTFCGNGRGGWKRRHNQNVYWTVPASVYEKSDEEVIDYLWGCKTPFYLTSDTKIVRIGDLNEYHQPIRDVKKDVKRYKSRYKHYLQIFKNYKRKGLGYSVIIEQRLRWSYGRMMEAKIKMNNLLKQYSNDNN